MAKRRAKKPPSTGETAGVRYIESSALVAALLEHDAGALKSVRSRGRKVTSALTIAETARAIVRARVAARLTADEERAAVRALRRFERRCYLVAVTDAVLARVRRPFRLGLIVRAADVKGQENAAVEGLGLRAAATGFALTFPDDAARLAAQFPLYDALYAYCQAL